MTLYTKPQADVFASAAKTGEIQEFKAWTRGLGIAFDETNGYPEMSGLNGLFNAFNLYIKYLEQNGFAEWRSNMEYPAGAGVRIGLVWYRAKQQSISKRPETNSDYWEVFLNASALSYQNPLYIQGNTIKVHDASVTQKGVVQFANRDEILNTSDVQKAITPYNVTQMMDNVKGQQGYTKLPNGLILKWGITPNTDTAASAADIPVTFTADHGGAFPTANLITITTIDASVGGRNPNMYASVTERSRTGASFKLYEWTETTQNAAIAWVAIGY